MKHTIEFFRDAIIEKGGLDEQEQALLFLLPLVQVAWAHSAISPREALVIFEVAREEGIDGRHWFNQKLDCFLVYQPSSKFFGDCLDLIRETLAMMTVRKSEATVEKLIARCEAVAAAAGDKSPMDTDHRVTPEEQRVLGQLREILGKRPVGSITTG
jgi:hypothetical protein